VLLRLCLFAMLLLLLAQVFVAAANAAKGGDVGPLYSTTVWPGVVSCRTMCHPLSNKGNIT
jgi:hypothetical protein